jgi:hypothetical protein
LDYNLKVKIINRVLQVAFSVPIYTHNHRS